jgi:hypothetical protein
MPLAEGTYILEVRASWEAPVTIEANTLFGRMIRRGKRGLIGGPTVSVVRRVTLAVLSEAAASLPARFDFEPGHNHDQEVDMIDFTRARGYRPSASGRTPWSSASRTAWEIPDEALAEPTRRDRLRGWITRLGPDVAHLAPSNESGVAWSALGLKVSHPGRPHRLTVNFSGGNPSSLGVAVVGQGSSSSAFNRPRLLLDVCASGPPILQEGPPASFSWLVWPDVPDPVLVLLNRAPAEENGIGVQIASVVLTELASLPAGPKIEEPNGATNRVLGLALSGVDALDRFGGAGESGPSAPLESARNLAQYLTFCGGTTIVLPEVLHDREDRRRLDGQLAEDATGPDRLETTLRVLSRQGVVSWLEVSLAGTLPGLPAPDSREACEKGLARINAKGRADGLDYHVLNPQVQAAIKRKVTEAVGSHQGHAKLAGILIRLGPGPTLLGGPETGLDDETFTLFAREVFDRETAKSVPGLRGGHDDSERFAARARFLAGPGRVPWLTWRAEQLAAFYEALTKATKEATPDVSLAVVTPALDNGPVGSEARRADVAGLDPSLAWRAVGLDLDAWPTGASAPIVLRGVVLGGDELANELATSPELDAKVAARTSRGLLLDLNSTEPGSIRPRQSSLLLNSHPIDSGPLGDEPLGHAMAALDPGFVILAATSLAGREERVRQFSHIFRGLPTSPQPTERSTQAFGVAVRSIRSGGRTFLSLANDTPYPIRVDTVLTTTSAAQFHDISRAAALKPEADGAGRHLVLDLLPFGATAIRINDPDAKITTVTPYPSEFVLTSMQARYDDLSTMLSWLSRLAEKDPPRGKDGEPIRTSPLNPGFEPSTSRVVRMSANSHMGGVPAPLTPGGWVLAGGMGATLTIDLSEPHSGRGSLRLDAPAPPAAVASDEFMPDVQSNLVVRVWLRSDRPDARGRLWIEGTSEGAPFVRFSEITARQGWQERAVRFSDIPPTGLAGVRIRFEMLSSGSLWIDDLAVSTETLSEPERRNARNALLAALQAYKEKRYADFARLAASRWTRHPAVLNGGSPELTRGGDPSALPQGRRLR